MKYRIESMKEENGIYDLKGFVVGNQPEEELSYSTLNTSSCFEIKKTRRNDVAIKYFKETIDNEYGFHLKIEKGNTLIVSCGSGELKFSIDDAFIRKCKFSIYVHNRGPLRALVDWYRAKKNHTLTYKQWYNKTKASKEELERQRKEEIKETDPKFSVLVPLYNTPLNFLDEMIESVIDQTYGKWELCLADGSDEAHVDEVCKEVKKYQDKDTRVLYKRLEKNEGISGNTNEALKMATGDFIVLFDHDDLLTEDALYEFAKAIREDEEVDCIYSDEDKIKDGNVLADPHFKPDYNIDMLCSDNYICHLFAVRKTLTDKYGGFRSEYDGSQDHDFILRMTEQARKTAHVAKILYHWRVHSNSTAQNLENKMYCFTSGQKAVKAHYERVWPNIKIDRVENGISLGIYHTVWHFDEYPLISVIIPNKDHTEDLDKAIRSMIEKGTWPNLEFIVVENNSEKEETFAYYEKIEKEYANVKVVKYEGSFNYSKINNYGAKYAHGDYFLLMNNDVELIEPDSMKEMMGYCQREDVGIVGCRLLYEDNTIQHAGVIIGIGVAEHVFKNQLSEDDTYFNRAMIAQDYSAVTAAVMLVKRSVYEELNGLDETFAVAFNDIDFCLRARELNKLVVYNPYACFHHYESKSRGADTTDEKIDRFMDEVNHFMQKWDKYYKNGDPYYNVNLSKEHSDFSIGR
jgi:O-antigen biosynthesis protein